MKEEIQIGDMVMIPKELNNGKECIATAIQKYRHFVVFEKENGVRMTLNNFECMMAKGLTRGVSEESNIEMGYMVEELK